MKKKSFLNLGVLLCLITLFISCQDEIIYSPKPRAYPKIDFPDKSYAQFDKNYCQFTFEQPTYAEVIQDKDFFGERPQDPCWFDLYIKSLNAKIHCSYIPIDRENPFDELVKDAFTLVNKHNIKADYIDEIPIKKENQVSGFVFDIEGAVASPFQFYLTDSTNHFLRASLYIEAQARPDSLAPIYEFIKTDMMHMVNTFEWKE